MASINIGTDEVEAQPQKYPAHFTFLPHDFCAKETDNERLLRRGPHLYPTGPLLRPSGEVTGVNRKSLKISTTIEFGEIYVIWAVGTTLYKIGVSTDFRRRFRDISAYSPLPVTVVKYARCDHPHLLESHLHDMFSHRLFKNEWFSLEGDDLAEVDAVFDRYFEKHGSS